MNSQLFYLLAAIMLVVSLIKDRRKTFGALKKAGKALLKLIPQMSFILLLIGVSLTLLSPETISALIGSDSGLRGIISGLAVGSAAFLPSFIAFPLGKTLLENGAGLLQVAAFISSLMGVGLISFSMEKKFFGNAFAVARNIGALLMTLLFVLILFLTGAAS